MIRSVPKLKMIRLGCHQKFSVYNKMQIEKPEKPYLSLGDFVG